MRILQRSTRASKTGSRVSGKNHRIQRARICFGERDDMIERARHEERLERAA